ncbi:hypothetical protein A1F96_11474, partial [Pyrenophora tritici-repentis]
GRGSFYMNIQLEYMDKDKIQYKSNRLFFREVEWHIYFHFTDLLYHLPPDRLPVQSDIWMDGHGHLYQKPTSNSELLPMECFYKKLGFGGRKLTLMEEAVVERYSTEGSSHEGWDHEVHE